MNRRVISTFVACLLLTVSAMSVGAPETAGDGRSPYAGQETRAITSLSAGDIDALQSGDGMGFASSAELNGYPGPRHVLDLAQELDLTPEQHRQTTELFEAMRSRAIAIGERLVEAEAAIDSLFRSGAPDRRALGRAVETAAGIRGELRFVHLDAHLDQSRILTAEQVRHYAQLRGYQLNHGAQGNHGEHGEPH